MQKAEPIVITGFAGLFPGAPDVDSFGKNLATASVAPTMSLGEVWKIDRRRYFGVHAEGSDTIYMDNGFCLTSAMTSGTWSRDRQVNAGRRAVEAVLSDAASTGKPLDLGSTALIAGTSWSAPSYFEQDLAKVLQAVGYPLPCVVDGPAYAPASQLEVIGAMLGGPRIAVDTACASSLYALDVALGVIHSGQARSAVVLGLNAHLPLFLYLGFSKLQALSHDGRILPFASNASGIVPGEAAGAVLIEPLSSAEAAGRRILGVLRSVGLAADGADRSVFAPGLEGQRLAFERAYTGIDPGELDYIEAHGTATALGDETELRSLDCFFGKHRDGKNKLPVGSVKSLIGHTLAAAGMASLIKVLLMLRDGILPPHVPVTPHPGLRDTCLRLLDKREPWPAAKDRPRRAGISSYGFGGANAHVVVESYAESSRVLVPVTEDIGSFFQPLAIIDMETAIGAATSTQAWRAVLSNEATCKTQAPQRRFGVAHPAGEALFPLKFVMDGAGLRMGPNFLRRLDPLQLLVTHQARMILDRNPRCKGSKDAAVVMVCDFGGELSLRMARRFGLHFREASDASATASPQIEQVLGPELTIEALASSLPGMCSGYPAFHFDLQGFHETLTGRAGTLFQALAIAPKWLTTRCHALLIGAGHTQRSPLEWSVPSTQSEQIPPGEGTGSFLVKTLDQARQDNDRVLCVLRAMVPGARAETWQKACNLVGVDPVSIDVHDVCELDPAVGVRRSSAQGLSGFLGEATGIESLSSDSPC